MNKNQFIVLIATILLVLFSLMLRPPVNWKGPFTDQRLTEIQQANRQVNRMHFVFLPLTFIIIGASAIYLLRNR